MEERVFLGEETRNNYVIDKKMKKVWNTELDLLCKLKEVCDKVSRIIMS